MAPARKGSRRVTKTNLLRNRKLASFLKDFDREGKGRARVVAATGRSRGAGALAAGSTGSIQAPFTHRGPRFCRLCSIAVQIRSKQILSDGLNILKEMDNLYNIEILRLPKALREMNCLDYFGERRPSVRGLRPGARCSPTAFTLVRSPLVTAGNTWKVCSGPGLRG